MKFADLIDEWMNFEERVFFSVLKYSVSILGLKVQKTEVYSNNM